jgi:hypothetical protein
MDRENDTKEYVPGKLYFPRATMYCGPTRVELVGHKVAKFRCSFPLQVVMFLSSSFVEDEDGCICAVKCLAGEEVVFLISHKWFPNRERWVYADCELVPLEAVKLR